MPFHSDKENNFAWLSLGQKETRAKNHKDFPLLREKRFNGTLHSGKLELCKAIIKNSGKQQSKMDPKKSYGGKELNIEAQFFALLPAYYHFRFRPCWLQKVFGTHVFLYFLGPMHVFPFFYVLDFYGGLLRRAVVSHPIHPPLDPPLYVILSKKHSYMLC